MADFFSSMCNSALRVLPFIECITVRCSLRNDSMNAWRKDRMISCNRERVSPVDQITRNESNVLHWHQL